jgi:NAD-dependent DNA ligase
MYTQEELVYLKAKEAYYNGEPIMSDDEFDALEKRLKAEN